MEQAKITLINKIVELSDSLQILICIGAEGKDLPDFIENDKKAYHIMKEQYGTFSLCFEEIKHTIDVQKLFEVISDFMTSDISGISSLLPLSLQWFNIFGHYGFIDENNKPEWLEMEEPQQPQSITPEPQQIPQELSTPEAKEVLTRGIKEGLLDNNYQPIEGIIRAQQKEFADLASEVLNIRNKWVVFGSLWNIKNLGQVKTSEAAADKLQKVRRLFPDLGYDSNGIDTKLKKDKFR